MIDAHVHCFPAKLADKALHATTSEIRTYDTDATVDSQLRLARKENIRKFVLLNFATRPAYLSTVNDFAIANNGREGRIISFGTVHPFADNAEEEVRRVYACGLRGIKLQPMRQGFSMDDPRCRDIFRVIGSLGMITVIHGGRSARTKEYPILPEHIAKCIDCFQGSPVVLSHMGGMFLSRAEISAAASLPVLTDTAYCAHHLDRDTFCYAFEQFGTDRVLFGTDLPWGHLDEERSYVDNLHLSPEEKSKIYDTNAEKLLMENGAWI